MFRPTFWMAGLVAVTIGAAASAASAGAIVKDTLRNPGAFFALATIDGCDNSGGPMITLEGELVLGGINGRVILKNNTKGTHTAKADVTIDATLLEEGERISFAKQPPRGGVGGNPWIYLQLLDEQYEPITREVLIGRCVQGIVPVEFDIVLPTDAEVDVSADACRNHPGPFITLEGGLRLAGLNGRLIFKNNRKKNVHVREEPVSVDFSISEPNPLPPFAKQPPLGGAGGNPRIYFQFTDADGDGLGREVFLGRCVQLGK